MRENSKLAGKQNICEVKNLKNTTCPQNPGGGALLFKLRYIGPCRQRRLLLNCFVDPFKRKEEKEKKHRKSLDLIKCEHLTFDSINKSNDIGYGY